MAQFVQPTSKISAAATGSTAGVALAANVARVFFRVQNVGANPLYLLYGPGTASVDNCHEILEAGTAALDGKGGVAKSSEVVFTGAISVGGTAPTYLAYEIAP